MGLLTLHTRMAVSRDSQRHAEEMVKAEILCEAEGLRNLTRFTERVSLKSEILKQFSREIED